MSDIAKRLSQLTPEQRAKLAARLAGGGKQGTESRMAPARVDPATLENFVCVPGTPGNFSALSFREVERVAPGPGQVQIEARAVALNFRDLMIAMGMYPPSPGVPTVMGSDYAGVVRAVGEGVTRFTPGDRVMALSAGALSPDGPPIEGSHFQAVTNLMEEQVAPMPENLSFEAAAGVPTVFLTAYEALCKVGRLEQGETLLVHSATGGLGQAALALARWRGARVFVTAGTPEKRAWLAERGYPDAMDSRTLEFVDEVRRRTDGGVDVILNTLSGEGLRRGLEALSLFGRFLHVGKQDIADGADLPLKPFQSALTFAVIDLALLFRRPARLQALFEEVSRHLADGDFAPVTTTAFPVARLGEALALMSRYEHRGKLVLLYG